MRAGRTAAQQREDNGTAATPRTTPGRRPATTREDLTNDENLMSFFFQELAGSG